MGAHPRRCGAHSSSCDFDMSIYGSSPQVRGAPGLSRQDVSERGLIPAGAGRTRWAMVAAYWRGAHPRRCGAHRLTAGQRVLAPGSSPQVRGARLGVVAQVLGERLIPAGAGRTASAAWRPPGGSAHPRRCGAHPGGNRMKRYRAGSSPQVRGALYLDDTLDAEARLIPAGAGRTTRSDHHGRRGGAHPRRCGAHGRSAFDPVLTEGSSPQVRGAHAAALETEPVVGLIPAGAGRTDPRLGGDRVA